MSAVRVRQHPRRTAHGRTIVGAHMRNRSDTAQASVPYTKADAARFEKLRHDFRIKDAAARDLDVAMHVKYGKSDWASRTEKAKRQRLHDARDKVATKIYEMIVRVNPHRQFDRGFPSHWIANDLSWSDATTLGSMSVTPPAAYGYSAREMQTFAGPIRITEAKRPGF